MTIGSLRISWSPYRSSSLYARWDGSVRSYWRLGRLLWSLPRPGER